MTYKAVIFDFDDTLTATEAIAQPGCYRYAVENKLVDPEKLNFHDYCDLFRGKVFADILKILDPEITVAEIERHEAAELNQNTAEMFRGLKPIAGAESFLTYLKNEHPLIKRLIVSNSIYERIDLCLQEMGIEHFFASPKPAGSAEGFAVFSAQTTMETSRPKPLPDIQIFALGKTGVLPSEAIAFEDSVTGIASLAAAGIKTKVGFLGAHNESDHDLAAAALFAAGADYVVSDWIEGAALFKTLISSTQSEADLEKFTAAGWLS